MMKPILSSYVFWLGVVSLGCLMAERVAPWRRGQSLRRPQLAQDVFWLFFNGYLSGIVFAGVYRIVSGEMDALFMAVTARLPHTMDLVAGLPLWAQIVVVLVAADFMEWCVHNALHRVGWLWRIHRVHHSIVTMDWIGNFRFHWGESLLYKSVKYLPLALLGARGETVLIVAVVSTTFGHLNHSNLRISWGPLRYLLNSPRMHIWHHDKQVRGTAGVNFGIVFSLWDWLFRTAHMPAEALQPEALGFRAMERVPDSLLMRFFLPFVGAGQPRITS